MSQNIYFLLKCGSNERYELPHGKDKFRIGRSPECDISFSSVFVSRVQCEISMVPNEDTLQLKNISKTNSTYVDNLQLNLTNTVAHVKVGSIIGLGVPVEYVNVVNSEFVFLKMCKYSNLQKTNEPHHCSLTRNNLSNEENKSNISVLIDKGFFSNATVSSIPELKQLNGTSYESPELTKKFKQGGSSLIDRRDKLSTCKQATSLNSQECKLNLKSQRISDVIILDEEDDGGNILSTSFTTSNSSSTILKNNIIKKEPNEFHEIKHDINSKVEREQLSKNETDLRVKIEKDKQKKGIIPLPDPNFTYSNHLKELAVSSPALHNFRCKSILENVSFTSKNELIPCAETEFSKGISSSSEHASNISLCLTNNVKSTEKENAIKTTVLAAMDAKNSPINQEYEYDYLDSEDASILEQIIVDETISKDKFVSFVEDVKPNIDILQASFKKLGALPISNCSDENQFNKLNEESFAVCSESIPQSLTSNSLISSPHNLTPTKNSHSSAPNTNDIKLKSNKPHKPMVYLPSKNVIIEDTLPIKSFTSAELQFSNDKCLSSKFRGDLNDTYKLYEAGSLKRTIENIDYSSMKIGDHKHKKICIDPVFDCTNLKSKKDDDLKNIYGIKDCIVLVQPLTIKKNCYEVSQLGHLNIFDQIARVENRPQLSFKNTNQPHNNQNMSELELHTECSPLEPGEINKSVNKQNVVYSSESDTRDSKFEGNSLICRNEELKKLNSKVDSCSTSNKNNQNSENTDYFIHKLSTDSMINEKENVFPTKSHSAANINVAVEKKQVMSVDISAIKEENRNMKHGISEGKNFIKENDMLKNNDVEPMNRANDDIKCDKPAENINKELDCFNVPIFGDVKVKEECTENELCKAVEDSSDEEDDDFDMINYSQMDDIIYISSDDEVDSSQDCFPGSCKDVSFGPLPPSPERELCLEETEQETDLSGKESSSSSLLCKESDKSCGADVNFKINELESDRDFSNKEDWWPILSQDFEAEENFDSGNAQSCSSYNSNETDTCDVDSDVHNDAYPSTNCNKNELDVVIEKIKKKKVGTTLLTDPKIPPTRKKIFAAATAKKHKNLIVEPECPSAFKTNNKCTEVSKASSFNDTNTISSKLDGRGNMDKPNCLTLCRKKLNALQKKKIKNNSCDPGNLRKKILKTHNLDPYKKIANSKTKERHHLISDPKVSEGKLNQSSSSAKDKVLSCQDQDRKSADSSISIGKGTENISVKPRSAGKKGIAKNSAISRSQKLTEVNLFKSPTKVKSKPKFKIPKKSSMRLEPSICNKENSSAALPTQPISVVSVLEKRVLPPVECLSISDQNLKKTITGVSHVRKSILKSPSKNKLKGPKNRVTFPRYDEDLCKMKIISPRKKSDVNHFSGPDNVKLKEMFIKGTTKTNVNICNRVDNPQQFVYNICNWNYDWLSTYQKAKNNPCRTKAPHPPKVCESTMLPTLTVYNSYDDYKEVFSNLMYYETWENIYKDWEQHLSNNTWFQSLVDSIQPGFLKTNYAPLKYCTVKLFIPISRDLSMYGKHPTQGSLIAMKHKHSNKTVTSFGYVQNIIKKTNFRYMPQELKAICRNNEDTVLQLLITFSKLFLENSLKSVNLVSISNVSYIKPSLRAYEALCQLKSSALCPALLNPGIICSMKNDDNCKTAYVIPEITLNDVQKNAIIKVSDDCTANLKEPKISLIHGPPGTGKTRTITALIAQINLLYKEKKLRSRRILLCAPSNAAVDELTLKLMRLREVNLNLNVVRFGVEQSFSQQVSECSFDTKVKKEFEKRIAQCQNISVQQELQQKKLYALSATADYEKALKDKKSKSEIKQLEIRMVELLRSLKDLEERSKNYLSSEEKVKLTNDCKKMILMQAEVIACTLNSCLSGAVYEIFSCQPSSFACCIVDEAGQCKETETWMPLQLGIYRLILVGDHLQLPATVLSNVAHGKKLHQSLFERVYHHVGLELQNKTVIHSLTLQYRMHEDICYWPSSHFYYNMLCTAPGVTQDRKCFLKPFILLDLEDSTEVNEHVGEICNNIEVQATVFILDCIASQLAHFSVGILTPYQKQRILLNEKVKPYSKDIKIKVSTIDNFQGQEKDLIICSFVRANVDSRLGFVSDRQRLNVALTRARKALIVIGHTQSLKSNEDWKSLIENCRHRNLLYKVNLKLLAQKKELYKLLEAKR